MKDSLNAVHLYNTAVLPARFHMAASATTTAPCLEALHKCKPRDKKCLLGRQLAALSSAKRLYQVPMRPGMDRFPSSLAGSLQGTSFHQRENKSFFPRSSPPPPSTPVTLTAHSSKHFSFLSLLLISDTRQLCTCQEQKILE